MKRFYTILKSRVEILLEERSVLCYSNTEIFPLAGKGSKLQKLLSAKNCITERDTVCLPCKGMFGILSAVAGRTAGSVHDRVLLRDLME